MQGWQVSAMSGLNYPGITGFSQFLPKLIEQKIESPHHKYVKRGLQGTKSVIIAEMTAALDHSSV